MIYTITICVPNLLALKQPEVGETCTYYGLMQSAMCLNCAGTALLLRCGNSNRFNACLLTCL